MIRTVIFDWDGTLHDTKKLYGASVRRAVEEACQAGIMPRVPDEKMTDEALAQYLGLNVKDMWSRFMPGLDDAAALQIGANVGRYMVETVREGGASLYPGAQEILRELKKAGYVLLFCSNCQKAYMEAHRSYFGLDEWISGFYCSEAFGQIPKWEIVRKIRDQWPEDFVMVGDRASDMEAALRNAGICGIGCAYGFGNRDELKDAAFIAEDVRDIPNIIKSI